ncbi:cobalt-precorrin 5A hydrolase [Neptuniibacter marinus]|uniref:cobalt-precorrin 5A hydrolase n=1 Tax=Neptuniibacter marinus TaxID=1806670 RepID=UPI000832229F|nr:cobalamin biosynthesis protein [Neptuniibacter marinus]
MIRVISLTDKGQVLGKRLVAQLNDALLSHKPQPFSQQVQTYFTAGERLIFICATGIVMRSLAPVLADKYTDPAVLVLDENGRFVIPLLSGHEGGANDWALQVSKLINAEPVITTANAYLHPIYSVGMGCERNCPEAELEGLFMQSLQQQGLSIKQISCLSSIDIKADEQGLISLAAKLGIPFLTWNKQQLSTVEEQLSTRSTYVHSIVGVYGVAESAALYSALQCAAAYSKQTDIALEASLVEQAELVMNKQKTAKATCAIARAYAS